MTTSHTIRDSESNREDENDEERRANRENRWLDTVFEMIFWTERLIKAGKSVRSDCVVFVRIRSDERRDWKIKRHAKGMTSRVCVCVWESRTSIENWKRPKSISDKSIHTNRMLGMKWRSRSTNGVARSGWSTIGLFKLNELRFESVDQAANN